MNTKERVYLTLLTVSVTVYIPFAHWVSTTPVGTELFLSAIIIYGLAGAAAVGAIPVSLVMLCFKRQRRDALLALILSLVYLPLLVAGIAWGMDVRMARMTDFGERSQPLINAINQYSDDHGGPPETLEQLVPDYLPSVPGTGMMAYPEYIYSAGKEACERYQENPWALIVPVSWGMNFDQMLYFPKQNYLKHGYGGHLERLGNWAYVHE